MQKLAKDDLIGEYPYRVIRALGEDDGGTSMVYLVSLGEVTHPKKDQLVALKMAKIGTSEDEFHRQTLENEVEYLKKVTHQGIVRLRPITTQTPNPIYLARATCLHGAPWFFVMEYLAGGSLAKLLKKQKKVEVGLALEIAYKLSKTLEYIHHRGCIHLDIKPKNVVFRQPLRQKIDPVLIDLGVARKVGQDLLGWTKKWSAPELIGDSQSQTTIKTDPSMDIYSLGLVLYRMLAGRLPFDGSDQSIAKLKGNYPPPSDYQKSLKPEIDSLVLSTIATNPADRPTTPQLAQELERLVSHFEHNRNKVWPISILFKLWNFLKRLI